MTAIVKVVKRAGFNEFERLAKGTIRSVKVGWFKKHRYPDETIEGKNGKQTVKPGLPVAYVAAANEFGVPEKNIPARPFMRLTMNNKKSEWKDITRGLVKRIMKGTDTEYSALEKLGLRAQADVRETIVSVTTPALSERTIKARIARYAHKKRTTSLEKPLEDTGHMRDTVSSTVE